MKIFVWLGHPRSDSFCGALADAYEAGARDGGADVRRINVGDMRFDASNFRGYGASKLDLEPDLRAWQEAINDAHHLAFVHPYWWGSMPAQAKAVLDRALAPGFGFKYRDKGLLWDGLLKGKSGDALITSDTPPLYDRLVYGMPGRRVLSNQVLAFCGVKVRQVRQFGPIKTSTSAQREHWLALARKMGAAAARR